MTSISITRALAELKTLNKRIEKIVNQSIFITTSVNNKNLNIPEDNMRSDWDSVNSLIDRYRTIKFAILQSNANTRVRIGTKTYTVTEAIAMKDVVEQKRKLFDTLRRQKVETVNTVESHNNMIQNKLDNLLQINFKERKTSEDDIKSNKEAYLKSNEIKVIDPIKIDNRISEMERDLEEFSTNIDFCLSESNAITTITV
jgi:predicted metalloprotease with PDZ domain